MALWAARGTCYPHWRQRATMRGVLYLVSGIIALWSAPASADLGRLVRSIARVGDDVPIRRIDEVAASPGMRRMAREVSDDLLRRTEGVGKAIGKGTTHTDDVLARTRAVRKALEETLSAVRAGPLREELLKNLGRLDLAAQEAALVLARGSKRLADTVPDIAVRSRLLRNGGGEMVAAIGRFDDLAEDALRFDLAAVDGAIRSPPGMRKLASEDFGRFFLDQGGRAHRFWTAYVRPHWKLWLTGTALAAVMLAPDEFLDSAGNLTQAGIEKLIKLGGEGLAGVLEGMVRGVGEATKHVVRRTTEEALKTFFSDAWGVLAFGLIACVVVFTVPLTRRWLIRAIRWLLRRGHHRTAGTTRGARPGS